MGICIDVVYVVCVCGVVWGVVVVIYYKFSISVDVVRIGSIKGLELIREDWDFLLCNSNLKQKKKVKPSQKDSRFS